MRVINNTRPTREAEVAPQVERQVSDPVVQQREREYEATCTVCLSQFAFRRTDEGVTMTNENEALLNCPVCDSALEVGPVTGIVRQQR